MPRSEHRFQAFADRLIDRVVMPPMFATAVDAAQQATDNQRARMAARGVKFGTPDIYVSQGEPNVSAWIELKVGRNKPTDRQLARIAAIRRTGIFCGVAWNMFDLITILQRAGFRLHGNIYNIAVELQAHVDAADVRKPPARQHAPRAKRPTAAAKRVGAAFHRP